MDSPVVIRTWPDVAGIPDVVDHGLETRRKRVRRGSSPAPADLSTRMSDQDLDVSQPYNRNALDIPFEYVVDLVLRRTLTEETTSVLRLSRTLGLGLGVVEEAFEELRGKKYLDVKTLQGNDYVFCLTAVGREQAKERYLFSQYTGIAPVSLDTYLRAVHLQRSAIKVNRDALTHAMGDLVVAPEMLDQLGPAFNSQHSIFFYGPAGTGKTSLAERLARLYPDWVVIPRALLVDGQIVLIYDPVVHERLPEQPPSLDPRWVACKRPLVTVGGEMDPASLDLHFDPMAGIYTAPIQVKANNGMLLIDDFGRQVMTPEQLLNRWIYPLAKRMDFLRLANGTKFGMPFELMVVFSTNMDPMDLGDEAFFRRIQNKVYVGPVDAEAFDRILNLVAPKIGVQLFQGSAEILKKICLERDAIGLRVNYPWDLCKMIKSVCEYEERPAVLDPPTLARAAQLYWGQLGAKMSAVKTNRGTTGPGHHGRGPGCGSRFRSGGSRSRLRRLLPPHRLSSIRSRPRQCCLPPHPYRRSARLRTRTAPSPRWDRPPVRRPMPTQPRRAEEQRAPFVLGPVATG